MATLDTDEALKAFVSKAKEFEAFASDNPDAYRWRAAALAALGYAAPIAVLLAMSVVFAVTASIADGERSGFGLWLAGPFGIALMLAIGVVARATWPRSREPDGVRLRSGDAPDLFALIDEVRGKMGNPRVHRVYVTDSMDAAVRQAPQFGYFGWHRNELLLGLPLLLSLTKQEVAAMLAHEFQHLSGTHDKLGAWVYRSRALLGRMARDIEAKNRFGARPFVRFYRWYQPFFEAYSFAFARAQEYAADELAAEAVSAQGIIDALARISIANDYIRSVFWNEVWSEVGRLAEPPRLVYGKLGIALVSLNKWDGSAESLDANLDGGFGYADTRPSMRDRARTLGVEVRMPPAISDAAAWLLPNDGAQLVVEFSERWQNAVSAEWTEKHTEIQKRVQRLAALDAAASKGPLNDKDALERGFLAEQFIDMEAALMRFEQALEWTGNRAPPLFQIARILLELGRDEGLACLKQVIELDDDSIVPACEMAESYLDDAGRGSEATDFIRRRKAHQELLDDDCVDRSQIGRADNLFPHECSDEKLEGIMRVIGVARKRGLRRAWMVRKATKHRHWEAAYFLVCDFGTYRRSEEDMDDLLSEMAEGLEGQKDVTILLCDPSERWLPTKVSMVANAKLFPQ